MDDLFITYDLKAYRLETIQGEYLASYVQQGRDILITNLKDTSLTLQKSTGSILSGNLTYFQGDKVLFHGFKQGNGVYHYRSEKEHLYTLIQISQTSFCFYGAKGKALMEVDWTVMIIKRIRARIRFYTSDMDPDHLHALLGIMLPHINNLHIIAITPFLLLFLFLLKLWLVDTLLPLFFLLIDKLLS